MEAHWNQNHLHNKQQQTCPAFQKSTNKRKPTHQEKNKQSRNKHTVCKEGNQPHQKFASASN